jgi:hypothetical protein
MQPPSPTQSGVVGGAAISEITGMPFHDHDAVVFPERDASWRIHMRDSQALVVQIFRNMLDVFPKSEAYSAPSRAHLRGASRSSRTWSAGCDGRFGGAADERH